MNLYKIKNTLMACAFGALLPLAGCNDYLDRAPLSEVTPDAFLLTEADLAAYTVGAYQFPSHVGFSLGTFGIDNGTDNQATTNASNIWVPGEKRVSQTGGAWSFTSIRNINYFINKSVDNWQAGKLIGNSNNIEHYIGEGYFLRAYEYFNKLQSLGDFPIVKSTLPDEEDILVESSRRDPRNEVARFILADLDSAIMLMNNAPSGGKNRLTQNAALLLKSRVGLYEGSWLTYHKGTAHVPGGPGWPGADYNEGFTIDIDSEIDFFLSEAMDAAKLLADAVPLEVNYKDNGYDSSENPYFRMFSSEDLSGYEEVLFWRDYDPSLGINHSLNAYLNRNGGNSGYTREFVDNVLMENGLPIYASGSGYQGDDYISDVKEGRDNRLQLFMKAPGELRLLDRVNNDGSPLLIDNPNILDLIESRYVTGYGLKKGFTYYFQQSEGNQGSVGCIVFRATEAYLNYIEASYIKEGLVNATAKGYWEAIRNRGGVNPDFMATANATDMSIEAENDFAAYSAGLLLNDPILYNIRRERRVELMSEGFRLYDLKRWRALDQLKTQPHIIEGFKLWGPMKAWYTDEETGETSLITPEDGGTPNVSSPSESQYIRPYRVVLAETNLVKDGYSWAYAHYLEPIAVQHFIISTPDKSGNPDNSVIYQNPYWTTNANSGAVE